MFTTYKEWNIEAVTGYKPITTFYMDFSIADRFGIAAVKDTFKRAMKAWKDNYKYLTELVLVLNWKQYEHYETKQALTEVYYNLWEEARNYALNNLKGEEFEYFWQCTD